jgi:hypothetical protein
MDPDEFFSKHAIQQVDVAGMDRKAIVHYGKMPQALGYKTISRQHHIDGAYE